MSVGVNSSPLNPIQNFDSSKATGAVAVKSSQPVKGHDLQSKITAQVGEIQDLWRKYEKQPNPEIEGTIKHSVADLENLLSRLPFQLEQIDETRDFLLACHMTMAGHFSAPAKKDELPVKADPIVTSSSPKSDDTMRLLKQNYHIEDVKGDGNCCIRAVLQAIDPHLNNDGTVHLVRGEMVRRMKDAMLDEIDNQWDDVMRGDGRYIPLLGELTDSQNDARAKVHSYCDYIARFGEWIDELELPFLAETVGRSIRVFDPEKLEVLNGQLILNDSMMKHGSHPETVDILHDLHHYQALKNR